MSELEISSLRKNYGKVEVIKGVDISVRDGEFISLIGSSGCGKSTLLRMIAGLESITAGTISLDRQVINNVEPKNRDVAMVFQNYALYPHMTVAENMGFSLHLRKVPKAESQKAVKETAKLLGLEDYLERLPKALSGGQRQRVAMGRAIVRNPRMFLFDEPLSNLDAKLRVQMRLEIKALQQRLGTTSVYVTHDQVEALTMSDRLVLLDAGKIAQIGTPKEVYHRPENLFVATFIGSPQMNILDCTLIRDAETAFIKVGATEFKLSRDLPYKNGTALKLGIRPEHLTVNTGEGDLCRFSMNVTMSETTGAETFVYGNFEEQTFSAKLNSDEMPKSGEILELSAPETNLHIFDALTGDRIKL